MNTSNSKGNHSNQWDTTFQSNHEVEFGLKIVGVDPKSRVVCSIQCQFCVYTGHETLNLDARKRKATDHVKFWSKPFRPELYRKHLNSQHSSHWKQYQLLNSDEKKAYFDDKVKFKDTLHHSFSTDLSLPVTFTVPASKL